MTKLFRFLISFFFTVLFFLPASGQAAEPIIYFFYGDGCPHCAREEAFLEKLSAQNPALAIKRFEVWYHRDNQELLKKLGQALGENINGVPFTIIGRDYFIGYSTDEVSGARIISSLNACLAAGADCPDLVAPLLAPFGPVIPTDPVSPVTPLPTSTLPSSLSLPLFGKVSLANLSLPALTVLIGALDGFNPCAMWVLIFLISLLFGLKDRRRMWILGGTFIAASAFVYFLFMAAWLNLLLFIGFIIWVRLAIGLVALLTGSWSLRDWWLHRDPTCVVSEDKSRLKIIERLKTTISLHSLPLALLGLILLAFAVNLVELMCSAGLPAVYTQVLILSNLPVWQYYIYLLLYVFIFMLDDLIVFSAAMLTLKVTGLSHKYARFSNLIGGVLMIILGFLLIFRPDWLMWS